MRKKRKPFLRSGLEDKVKTILEKGKIKYKYEPFPLEFVQPAKKRKYIPDFQIEGNGLLIEVKGRLTKDDRDKLIWVREQNPEERIVLLFGKAENKIRKGSKTTYADWATKNGFEFADFGKDGVPQGWVKGK